MDQGQTAKIIASFQALGRQIQAGEAFKFPKLTVNQPLVWMGMGGSSLGAFIWQSYCRQQSRQPLIVWRQPALPGFLNRRSLVFVSSYSGQTRETLDFYRKLSRCQVRIFGLTGGGQLEKYFRRDRIAYLKISGGLNPSRQPRHGVGFSLGFLSAFYGQQSLLPPPAMADWRRAVANFPADQGWEGNKNVAALAKFISSRPLTIIIASSPFYGLGRFWQNQLQETAKQLAIFAPDPDLRHHLPEALAANKKAAVVFLKTNESDFSPLINWLRQQEIPHRETVFPKGNNAGQLLWGINFGQYLALQIARLNHRDANEIAAINWLKRHKNT